MNSITIKVLDHTVELIYVNERSWTGDCIGDFQETRMVIRIIKGLPRDIFATTLLHELVHVKQFLFGKLRYDDEEEANHDALFFYSLMQNNPKLFTRDIVKSLNYE